MFSKNVTINTANTWEKKSVVIPADTGGTINNDSGSGLQIAWWVNGGSTYGGGSEQTTWGNQTHTNKYTGTLNIGASTADNFYLTGVQLEVGSVATDFEHRNYGEELALCQRYYYKVLGLMSSQSTRWLSGYQHITLWHPVIMRANPTFSDSGGSSYTIFAEGATDTPSGQATIQVSSKEVSEVYLPSSHAQKNTFVRFFSTSKFYEFSAEL